MQRLSEKEFEKFFDRLEQRKYHKEEFYELFLDYLEEIQYYFASGEESLVEPMAYKMAYERGLIGYNVLYKINDIDKFSDILNKRIKLKNSYIFHFIDERKDEEMLSLCEVWNKWNDTPPLGWLAGWCNCGEFFPYTLDMGLMDIENNKLFDNNLNVKPKTIYKDDIEEILFCSDDYMRFKMKDGNKFAVKVYKLDKGFNFNFTSNPLELI